MHEWACDESIIMSRIQKSRSERLSRSQLITDGEVKSLPSRVSGKMGLVYSIKQHWFVDTISSGELQGLCTQIKQQVSH